MNILNLLPIMNSPQFRQIVNGKNPQQLMQEAEKMCQERGTTVDEVLKRYGITR